MYAVFGYSFAAEMEKAVKNGMGGCETAEQFVAMCADGKAVLCVEIRQMSEHISERDHISIRYSKLKNNT